MTAFTDSLALALQLMASLDAVLLAIVGRSLGVSASACALACSFGLAFGAWLGVARFAGRGLLLALLNSLLAVPSVVVGLWSTCCCRAAGRWARWAGCFRSRPWCWRRPCWSFPWSRP